MAVTPKSIPFAESFKKKYGNYPSYAGYTSYDEVYYIADAIKRAGSTDADKVVDALEKTDWEGTIGRIQFYGKDDQFTHGQIRQGPDHRPDAAVAGWQTDQRLAEGSRQRPVEVPKLRQGYYELIPSMIMLPGSPGSILLALSSSDGLWCRGVVDACLANSDRRLRH